MKNKQNNKHKSKQNRNKSASYDRTQKKSNFSSIIFQSNRNSLCSPKQNKNANDKYNTYIQFISSGRFIPDTQPSKQTQNINRAKASTPTPRRLSASLIDHGRKSVTARQHPLKDLSRNSRIQDKSPKAKSKPLFVKGSNIIKSSKNAQQFKKKESQDQTRPASAKKRSSLKPQDNKRASKLEDKNEEKQKKLIAKLFANIQFHRNLGRGAHALVKSGVDFTNRRKIAVKIYQKNQLTPDQIKSIQNQVEILGSLNHPTIIKLLQIIQSIKTINLVMQYGGGNSLQQYIRNKSNGRLEQIQARTIFRSIVTGIAYLHEKGVAHRDIKTDNILLNKYQQVKIIDFGFSYKSEKKQLSTIYCGTPTYMAPEIVTKTPHSPFLADRWSLGILLYNILHGHCPFKAQNQKELFQKICERQIEFQPHISNEAKDLIVKLLAKNAEERPSPQQTLSHQWLISL